MNEEKDKTVEEKIKEALDSVRPFIIMDGGDIEFVKYEDNIVYIKFLGACMNCLYSDDTFAKKKFKHLLKLVHLLDQFEEELVYQLVVASLVGPSLVGPS